MSKRLQVVVDDAELRRYQRAARRASMTLSAWVRQNLQQAEAQVATGKTGHKLEAIRSASEHAFPTGPIDQILEEIEQGSLGRRR